MDTGRGIRSKRAAWRGRRALRRASAVLCALALALGVMGMAPAGSSAGAASDAGSPWEAVRSSSFVHPGAQGESAQYFLHFDSEPGDYIGRGSQYSATGDTATFSGSYYSGHAGFSVIEPGYASWWYLDFAAIAGSELTPGVYENALRYPFHGDTNPGLSISGNGRGCNTLTGRFEVDVAEYGPSGEVLAFSARFEQHCEGAEPALRGEIGYGLEAPPPPPPAPSPWFKVYPQWESVEALNWPSGVEVTATVTHQDLSQCGDSATSSEALVAEIQLPEGCTVAAGDIVTVSGGLLTKEHTVTALEVTWFNVDENWAGGLATPGLTVELWVHGVETSNIFTSTDGAWGVDLDDVGYDLVPGSGGRATQADSDGDRTEVDWSVPVPPNPWLIAFPENNAVEAWEWQEGATVYLSIDDLATPDSPDHAQEGVMHVTTWGDPRTYLLFNFSYDLKPGDVVTVTDLVTERTHVVQSLSVTAVDAVAETVGGTADSGAVVDVWPHGADQITTQSVPVLDGVWTASFIGLFDLAPGVGGRSRILDGEGNYTAVDWSVPNSRFTVFPEGDYIEGYEWLAGATLSVDVDEPDCSFTYESPDGYLSSNFPELCDIGIGDTITMTDGVIAHTHTIQDLTITSVDTEADTVAGNAIFDPALYMFHTWIHGVDGSYVQPPVVGSTWQVDYRQMGIDLRPGMGGRAEIVDEDSDATAVEWRIYDPHFTVFPEWEFFDGLDWPDGTIVTITVANKPECKVTKESWGGFFNGNFGDGCNVEVGDTVTFDDGATSRTHVVRNLSVTSVDAALNTVAGVADEGAVVFVWPHETGQQLSVTAGASGAWQVDFTGAFDIVPGSAGRSETRDSAGNATAVDWYVPNPRFTVFPEWEWMDGYDWPDGAIVTITVEGKPECGTTAESWDWFFNGSFGAGCDVRAGDAVMFTAGETTRSHVVRNLSVSKVEVDADTVAGRAEEGATVHVWPHETGQQIEATTDRNGRWLADFGGMYDIVPLSEGRSEIRDEDGNATAVDWVAGPPPPRGERQWVVAYTHDVPPGTLAPGSYPYHFKFEWTFPEPGSFSGQEGVLDISTEAPIYDGSALLRGSYELVRVVGRGGLACEEVDSLNPSQPARFLIGWLTDQAMTYPEARAFFESLDGRVVWGEAESGVLVPHEIRPWPGDVEDWYRYVCTFTRR